MKMTEIGKNLMPSKDVQERCSSWVESQQDVEYTDETNSKRKAKSDYDDIYATDSEFDSVSECGGKKRKLGVCLKNEVFHLCCDWIGCVHETTHLDRFVRHVAVHVGDVSTKTNENNVDVYFCQWNQCLYETSDSEQMSRHINYHAYHTKLKCIGTNIRGRVKLPKCHRDSDWKIVSDLPLLCRWGECLKYFRNYQFYLYHVAAHIEECPRGNKVDGGIDCKWTGCKSQFSSLYKLRDHMRCHTKEKTVACPDCGSTFASNTKFHVHCKRQIPIDVQGFQCSHCNKFYPTEGILRDHMRLHIFNYKCSLCDMSCESPASLAKHIRYRHVSTRSFHCQLCSHSAKSQQDLDSHMTVHTTGPNFSCHYEGCPYTCKGPYALDRHLELAHARQVRWYCCHECPVKYRKSQRLTKHLVETHRLQLPSGHKRFQYTHDEDGYYRLRMVRYEAVDDENLPPAAPFKEKKYRIKLNKDTDIPNVEVSEVITENDEDDEDEENESEVNSKFEAYGKSMPIISNILISIDDTDADGNIINSKIVETQETSVLPPSDIPPIILT